MPAEMPTPTDGDTLVRTVTDNLVRKFPGLDRAAIELRVGTAYQRLAAASRINDHLAVLVLHDAAEQLRAMSRD